MPRVHPVYTDFTGGEWSPKMMGRIDVPRYQKACKELTNFIVMRQGGARRRGGTQFVEFAKDDDKYCRIIPFIYSATQSYIIEFGDLYMRFFMDGYRIGERTGSELVTNGQFTANIASWSNISTAPGTITWHPLRRMVLNGGVGGTAAAQQAITTVAGTEYELEFDTYLGDIKIRIGTTSGGGEILPIDTYSISTDHAIYFTAQSTTTYLQFINDANVGVMLDNPSVQAWTPIEITTPYDTADLTDLKHKQSSNYLYLAHPDYPPMKLTRISHTEWNLDELDLVDGPYMDEVTLCTVTNDASTVINTSTVLTAGPDFITDGAFGAGIAGWTDLSTGTGTIAWNVDHMDIAGGAAGIGWAQQLIPNATGTDLLIYGQKYRLTFDTAVPSWLMVRIGITSGGNEILDDYPCAVGANVTEFDATAEVIYIQFRNAQNATGEIDNIVLRPAIFDADHVGCLWRVLNGATWGYVKITSITNGSVATGLIKGTIAAAATESTSYQEGAFSDYRGYPRCLAIHENRLIFASSDSFPATLWASKTGNYADYENFTPGTLDDDAWTFTIPSNSIEWMETKRKLIVGAMNAVYQISGDPAITPTNVEVREEETTKASSLDPVKVGHSIIFVEWARRQLMELTYNWESDTYVAPDLCVLSSHLFEDAGIWEITSQSTPYSIIWVLREDGILLGMSYERLQDTVVAWHYHYTDGGIIESIAVIPDELTKEDKLWLVVRRTINGTVKRCIEFLNWNLNTDCALTYVGDSTTAIGGLDHLIGESVMAVGDGIVFPAQIVASSGQITLSIPCSEVEVGYNYLSRLIPVSPEVPVSGTSKASQKRWSECYVKLVDSMGLTINGEPITFRRPPDLAATAVPLFSGDKKVTPLGWDKDAQIVVEQAVPLPCMITCIFGTLEVGD